MKKKAKKKREDAAEVFPSHSESFKLVHDDGDTMIYEGGWWMKKSDWRTMWIDNDHFGSPTYGKLRKTPRPDIGMDRNERTRQITIFIIPTP